MSHSHINSCCCTLVTIVHRAQKIAHEGSSSLNWIDNTSAGGRRSINNYPSEAFSSVAPMYKQGHSVNLVTGEFPQFHPRHMLLHEALTDFWRLFNAGGAYQTLDQTLVSYMMKL